MIVSTQPEKSSISHVIDLLVPINLTQCPGYNCFYYGSSLFVEKMNFVYNEKLDFLCPKSTLRLERTLNNNLLTQVHLPQ